MSFHSARPPFRRAAFALAPVVLALACSDAPSEADLDTTPERIGPGIVSTSAIEDSVAFLPDGTLLVSRRDGAWGEPATEPCRVYVHGAEADGYREVGPLFPDLVSVDDPFVAPDGERLVFVSREEGRDDRDLWIAERDGDGWGTPRPLPAPINTRHTEMGPSLDRAGNLLFATDRPGGAGSGDLWIARRDGDRFLPPVPLPAPVNARTGEWNGLLAPDGDFIVFEASERPENVTPNGDLYVTWRLDDDGRRWSQPAPLVELNGRGSELNARLTPDGRWLVFASSSGADGAPDLYRVPASLLDRYRPAR